MSGKQLLREYIQCEYSSALIKEDRALNGGKLMLRGIIQKAETKNQNNRIYPRSILVREADNYQKAVRENRAVGELDHPDTSTVSLERVSHIIREMAWTGNDLSGVIEVLGTPKGKILETLIESGVTIGISSRGVGSTNKDNTGCDIVQDDFQLVAFDIVSEPSTPGAYLYLKEGWDRDVVVSKQDRVFRRVNDALARKGHIK